MTLTHRILFPLGIFNSGCRRVGGPRRRPLLQGQTSHHPHQLRPRRTDRRRGPPVRRAHPPPHRRCAQRHRPDRGRRRWHRRRQVSLGPRWRRALATSPAISPAPPSSTRPIPSAFASTSRPTTFVATQAGTTVHFVRPDVAPGMKEATDIAKAKDLVVGGLSLDTPKDLRARLGMDTAGCVFQIRHRLLLRARRDGRLVTAAWSIPLW